MALQYTKTAKAMRISGINEKQIQPLLWYIPVRHSKLPEQTFMNDLEHLGSVFHHVILNEADDTSVYQTYVVTRLRAYKDKYCNKLYQTRLLCNEVTITKSELRLIKVMQWATARTL